MYVCICGVCVCLCVCLFFFVYVLIKKGYIDGAEYEKHKPYELVEQSLVFWYLAKRCAQGVGRPDKKKKVEQGNDGPVEAPQSLHPCLDRFLCWLNRS